MASEDESENSSGATPVTLVAVSFNAKNTSKTFAQQITLKLDENNFRSWKQQVKGIIRTHKLHRLLVSPMIPPRFLYESDCVNDVENPVSHPKISPPFHNLFFGIFVHDPVSCTHPIYLKRIIRQG